MHKNNKEKTIEACRELIKRYELMEDKHGWFASYSCPLCNIHQDVSDECCKGCPLANDFMRAGCLDFNSAKELLLQYDRWQAGSCNYDYNLFAEAAKNRAGFYRKIIPILKRIPKKRFTKEGGGYFKEINRSW